MAGESILLIEDSPAERDIAKTALESSGYRVIPAANAAAALTFPDIKDISMIVLDSALDGVSGFETTRMLREMNETHPIPILMLIPEDQVDSREDLSARGADGYLLKPYNSQSLVRKVGQVFEQRNLEELSRRHLAEAADEMLKKMADGQIKEAVGKKTQLIIQRCIQDVTTAVDKRAREEVDKHVTELTQKKEQELVKVTVREIAQTMIEKQAERRVAEAMEKILKQETERVVKRITDQIVPGAVREKLKDNLNNLLPREIQVRLQKAAEKMVPELSGQLVTTMEAAAGKSIPRLAREILPDLIEKQIKLAATQQIPPLVGDMVRRELDNQLYKKIEPSIHQSEQALRKLVLKWGSIVGGAVVAGIIVMIVLAIKSGT